MIQDRLYGLKSNGCWFLKKEQALENGQRKPIKNVWLKSNGCWCLKRDQALGMDIKEMIKESPGSLYIMPDAKGWRCHYPATYYF